MSKTALYARVSTVGKGQDPEGQLIELRRYSSIHEYESIEYKDQISCKEKAHPVLDRLRDAVFHGDIGRVVVWDLSRLGRSLKDLLELIQFFEDNGVDLVVLRQKNDTSTASGRFFLQVMGALAEFEREMIRDRILMGLERSRAQGKHIGRKPKKVREEWLEEMHAEGLPVREITQRYNERVREILTEQGMNEGTSRWNKRWKAESISTGTVHRALTRLHEGVR